jgi:phospholipid/cholesterol/gamma-HCH transport system substrate-binding protein
MGKLLNDDALYTTFQNFKELELLLQDVRLHPTRYVNVSLFWKEKNHIKLPCGYYFKEKISDYELFR